ncbi:hypothetical protein MLP_52810 [Microlunatus phosphovorus NM-1]|uniref:FHA domain-containing protein n=1 Tax=Microlunatus phosphovorus (strain ATCC 700054 / DSM 10555 / JCM 9379 / NBRC 101784 / NCIMB 13414 / VKM Ac-1990 / NM-1) TaxID=1032480 RepID=F5XIQ7_MICPN|nr:DUF3662 and FHA domain-containing protein [Microlunatus phosphovorus]BAK38295.1 hypothetical protein MLP_52810 [Microlunatus phosphovorus NM-1]
MSIFGKFEKKVESAVNGVFARAFKGDVQPVEIAARLQKELDAEAKLMSRDKRLVPNEFRIGLSEHDYAKLTPYSKTLIAELAGELKSHAREMGYVFNGPIRIHFEEQSSLPTGRFTVESEAVAGTTAGRVSSSRLGTSPSAGSHAGPVGSAAPSPWSAPSAGSAASAPSAQSGPSAFSAGSAHSGRSAESASDSPYGYGQSQQQLVLEVNGMRHPLTPPGFVIGRGTDADVRINDPGISRLHAEVTVHPSTHSAEIVDLGSTNGITVNGQKVQRAPLVEGTRIEIGSTRMLVHAPAGR